MVWQGPAGHTSIAWDTELHSWPAAASTFGTKRSFKTARAAFAAVEKVWSASCSFSKQREQQVQQGQVAQTQSRQD